MKNVLTFAFLSAVGFATLACSNSDDAQERSGVAESTSISTLNSTDTATVCDWYIELISNSNYIDRVCHELAVATVQMDDADFASDDTLRAACTNAETACTTKVREHLTDIRQTCITSLDAMTCTAKVSDFENCAIAITETPTTELPSCNSLSINVEIPTASTSLRQPPECEAFNSLCSESAEGP